MSARYYRSNQHISRLNFKPKASNYKANTMSDFFIHEKALVETNSIGTGTRIWAFAHVMSDVTIGADCNVGDHVFIETGVTIGDGVTVKNNVLLWKGVDIADYAFIGPNVVFTNDLRHYNQHQ